MNITSIIAGRIRELRSSRGWSLETLAERSAVSRATISLIERGQSSPTATVLDKLASALGVSLASLFEQVPTNPTPELLPISRAHEQQTWRDPESGYVRRNLSPPVNAPTQLVEVSFPPGQSVSYETAHRDTNIHQQIWVIEGEMVITVGEARWVLKAGDCLAMRLDSPTSFRNVTSKHARYLVALTNYSFDNSEN